jgi:hypothetical protein
VIATACAGAAAEASATAASAPSAEFWQRENMISPFWVGIGANCLVVAQYLRPLSVSAAFGGFSSAP